MRTLYHGSRVTVEQPEIRIQKFHKDFYWGFYCTEYETQATRWATRFGSGIVNVYRFEEQSGLSVKRFPEMSDEWLDFIVACRSGIPHNYDIVEGPMTPSSTMYRAIQMARSAAPPSGSWHGSSIPPIRSASTPPERWRR